MIQKKEMIYSDPSLKPFNTFGLDYKADILITVSSEEEIISLVKSGMTAGNNKLILGGGSNLLFLSDFHGTIIKPDLSGISIETENDEIAIVKAGAGLNWDDFVQWSVDKGLGGVENLSFIPGSVGATPVQNIGAYGVEIKDIIEKARAISLETGEIKEFSKEECCFGYRDSIFKRELKDKYIITRVTFRLSRKPRFRLGYGFLEAETAAIGEISLKNVRKAVIKIRKDKLPDPSETGNAGSFFKNPVVSNQKANELKYYNPLIPIYDEPSGGKKLAAGWLIEQCGWKGKRNGDAGVHDKQALVIVNYGNATGKEVFDLSEMIKKSVAEKFGVHLQREVEVIGSI